VTHLHVPDGVLPWWAAAAALVVAAVLVAAALAGRRDAEGTRFLSRTGVMAATLIVSMSLPLGPGVHLSLAPLAGMMLGPAGGFLAAFLANASLSVLGHGGLTALGINGLFLGAQAAAGAGLFALLRRPLGVRGGAVAATAVVLATAAAAGLLAIDALPIEGDDGHGHGREGEGGHWGFRVVVAVAAAAAAIESWITSSVVGFLARVRSDLVHGGGAPRPRTSGEPA
jgi:cobalt/nickel transport system permease protein